jgi:hypothetical protein
MMVVDPLLTPLTVVAARALVLPCGMEKTEGHAVAIEGSLLARVTFTPPAGAGVPSDTGKLTVLLGITVTLTGNRIPPAAGAETLTVAVALPMLGALAVIVTDPPATPVTGTGRLLTPVANVTVAGTVATVVSPELSLTTSVAGAGAERFSVRFCVAVPLIVRLTGEKFMVGLVGEEPPVTCTCPLAIAYPGAEAVIVADPALLPVTIVTTRGAVTVPPDTKSVDGNTVAMEGLLVASVMKTPPTGAAVPNATGKLTVSPGASVTLTGRTIPGTAGIVTVTVAVALAMSGALAVIDTNPAPTPVTGTDTEVAPGAKLKTAGTVAMVGSLELSLTAKAAAEGAERLSVRFCVVDSLTVKLPGQKLIVVAVVAPEAT